MAMAGFSVSKNGKFFIRGKGLHDNLNLYHVLLTTEAKDRRVKKKRKGKTELHHTKEVLTCVLPRGPKQSAFLPTATVSCVSEKQSTCLGSRL